MVEREVAVRVHDPELVALLIEAKPSHLSEGAPWTGLGHHTRLLPLTHRYGPVLAAHQIWQEGVGVTVR